MFHAKLDDLDRGAVWWFTLIISTVELRDGGRRIAASVMQPIWATD